MAAAADFEVEVLETGPGVEAPDGLAGMCVRGDHRALDAGWLARSLRFDRAGILMLARRAGEHVGYLRAFPLPPEEGRGVAGLPRNSLYVQAVCSRRRDKADEAGRGAGAALLRACEERARGEGKTHVVLRAAYRSLIVLPDGGGAGYYVKQGYLPVRDAGEVPREGSPQWDEELAALSRLNDKAVKFDGTDDLGFWMSKKLAGPPAAGAAELALILFRQHLQALLEKKHNEHFGVGQQRPKRAAVSTATGGKRPNTAHGRSGPAQAAVSRGAEALFCSLELFARKGQDSITLAKQLLQHHEIPKTAGAIYAIHQTLGDAILNPGDKPTGLLHITQHTDIPNEATRRRLAGRVDRLVICSVAKAQDTRGLHGAFHDLALIEAREKADAERAREEHELREAQARVARREERDAALARAFATQHI